MRDRVFGAAILALLASVALRAEEPTDEAKKLFATGSRLFEEGRFREAAAEYERAYRSHPLPELLFDVASAYDKAGAREEAVGAYKRYLALPAHDAKDDPSITARIGVLERELATIAQSAPRHTAYPYVEPLTRHSFPSYLSIGGRDYALVGVGARSVFGVKVYGMGLYVDDEHARAAFPRLIAQAGGADLASLQRGDQAQQFLMLGDFGKHALLHFERGVPAVKLREAYRQSLADDAGPNATPELRRDTEAFLALFDRDVNAGDDVNIHTDPDGQVFVRIGSGHTRSGPTNPRLAHDIWAAWLGPDPISTDLKRQLVGRIDVLGR